MSDQRIEKDSMGEMSVPADALYGASTQRAVLNFPVAGRGFDRSMIRGMGLIKWAAALANKDLGVVPVDKCDEHEHECERSHRESLLEDRWPAHWFEGASASE